MARTQHFPVQAKIPIYSVGFVDDNVIVYSGGGGASRSGVTNAVVAAHVDLSAQTIHKLDELKLSRDEDAPMAMSVNAAKSQLVCGINNAADDVKKGNNQPIRIFSYASSNTAAAEKSRSPNDGEKAAPSTDKGKAKQQDVKVELHFEKAVQSMHIRDPEQYVKVVAFSPNGRMLAIATTDGQLALHRYPSLSPIWNDAGEPSSSALAAAEAEDASISIPSQDFDKSEVYDADFSHSNTYVVFTSASKLVVYATSAFSEAKADEATIDDEVTAHVAEGFAQTIQTIKNPALGGKGPCSFRAARFGRGDASKEKLFTVVNAARAGGKGPKAKIRKSFVTAWDADTWDLIETRHVSDRPVTVFDVSPDGKFLAYGSSDLSIGVLDAKTLRPVLKILHAHDFPPTCLKFNPASNLLISASADNTLRVIPIPAKALLESAASAGGALAFISETRMGFYTTIFLSLLIAALALWFQRRYLIN